MVFIRSSRMVGYKHEQFLDDPTGSSRYCARISTSTADHDLHCFASCR